LKLSEFKDEFGLGLNETVKLKRVLARQIPSAEEAAAIESSGSSAEGANAAVMGTNFIVSLVLAASLN